MSVRRALSVYREHGLRELSSRSRHVVRHRAIRPHIIANVPFPFRTFSSYLSLREAVLGERFIEGNPFTLYYVDPRSITHVSGNSLYHGRYRPIYWGRVEAGLWDRSSMRFDDLPVPKAIHLHYKHGVPWEETPLRVGFENRLKSTAESWSYNADEFDRRVDDIEQLVDTIRNQGYRSKRDLAKDGPISTSEAIPPLLDEVTVDIGRDERPYFRFFGVHRLAIAKLLDINEIPVLVGAWHRKAIGPS